MVNVSIARRYARALLEVALEAGALDKVSDQLQGFAKLLEQNKDLNGLLTNPAYTRSQRMAVTDQVLLTAKVEPVLANTIRLLVERNRIGYIPDIARVFRDMADVRAGRVRGKVTTAVALSPDVLQKLEKSLERLTQRNVVLEAKVDPAILGGMSAQVGSVLYDGSLRSQLEELRRTLKSR